MLSTFQQGQHMSPSFVVGSEMKREGDGYYPGFIFRPTEEELVGFYLRKKVENAPLPVDLIIDLNIYKFDPWDLPKMSPHVLHMQNEWYFFCLRQHKYRNSSRPNRVTTSGFWKATGTDHPIICHANNQKNKNINNIEDNLGNTHCNVVGLKKSLVFYQGKANKSKKTDWMMHEFRFPGASSGCVLDTKMIGASLESNWALCKIFKRKSTCKLGMRITHHDHDIESGSINKENTINELHDVHCANPKSKPREYIAKRSSTISTSTHVPNPSPPIVADDHKTLLNNDNGKSHSHMEPLLVDLEAHHYELECRFSEKEGEAPRMANLSSVSMFQELQSSLQYIDMYWPF